MNLTNKRHTVFLLAGAPGTLICRFDLISKLKGVALIRRRDLKKGDVRRSVPK